MLEKYEVLKLDKGTHDVKIMLKQNNFIENKEYQIHNIMDLGSHGGTSWDLSSLTFEIGYSFFL